MPPTRIAHWDIERKIGRGTFGTVYEATNRRTQSKDALKVVDRRVSHDLVKREALVLGQFDGAPFPRLHDVFRWKGRSVIAMEYITGTVLSDLPSLMGKLGIIESSDIVAAIAKNVGMAHSKGVLHRDIKPSNLIHDENNDVRVLDLGIAKIKTSLTSRVPVLNGTISLPGWRLGTPDYLAPEQANDSRLASEASDIYAIGGVWYYLVHGIPMFPSKKVDDVIKRHQQPQRPQLFPGGDPAQDAANKIFARMVAKDLLVRYRLTCQLTDDLEKFQNSFFGKLADTEVARKFLDQIAVV